ncbi:MAG: TonB-dependent receptor, partial [Bacteroidales bacterium]|nr:TonB-dependent receptor [Bacteroidales bacterium]
MKKINQFFIITTIISVILSQVSAERFWWSSAVSNDTNEFMSIYFEENLPLWETSRSRIDGLTLRRESAGILDRERDANTPEWQAMSAFIPTWDITFAMNSGASNKSWEKEPSGAADTQRRGDLAALENLTAAGARHVTMFLQSPMSKGNKKTFIDGPDGASIATRIEDIKRYINWIEARKPEGVLVDYALIDAHPAKGIFPDPADYQDVYRQLATALRDAGMPFAGIMFDWKASTISQAGARELIDICKWVQTDLSQELGQDYYAGWWIWYYVKNVSKPTLYQRGLRGVGYVMDEPDNHWISHVYIGAALGDTPMLPDTVNGFPVGRLEGINENYELMEPKIADKLSIELQGMDSILLNWEVGTHQELPIVMQRKIADTGFADIAQLTTLDTTYLDTDVVRGEIYTYRIYAPDGGAGREFSNEASLRVPDIVVEYRNQSSDPQSNTIVPQIILNNTGGFEYNYEDLSVRYWFTAENYNDLVFAADWAAIGAQNIAADYVAVDPLRVGGNYYAENSNTTEIAQYWLVNGRVGYDVTSTLRIQAGVRNLFDKMYFSNVRVNANADREVSSRG